MGLAGRTFVVTGAARGIGEATARALAQRGVRVALVGLEPERLQPLAEELDASWFAADVTDAVQLGLAVEATLDAHGAIDGVIANAGVYAVGDVATIPPEDFDRVIEVNLLGVWRTVRATLPAITERRGYILSVASLAAAVHLPLMASYAASKAGVEAFANALRAEVASDGVDVGVAYFSYIDTDMVRGALAHPLIAAVQEKIGGRGFLVHDPLTPEAAADAIVDAVVHRRRRVVRPRYAAPLLYTGSLVRPLIGRLAERTEAAKVARELPTVLVRK